MAVFDRGLYKWYKYNHKLPLLLERRGGDVKLHKGMKFGIRDATTPSALKKGISRVIIGGHPETHVFTVYPPTIRKLLDRSMWARQ